MTWFMNGGITIESSYNLTPSQRKKIVALIEHQADQKKKANKQ